MIQVTCMGTFFNCIVIQNTFTLGGLWCVEHLVLLIFFLISLCSFVLTVVVWEKIKISCSEKSCVTMLKLVLYVNSISPRYFNRSDFTSRYSFWKLKNWIIKMVPLLVKVNPVLQVYVLTLIVIKFIKWSCSHWKFDYKIVHIRIYFW